MSKRLLAIIIASIIISPADAQNSLQTPADSGASASLAAEAADAAVFPLVKKKWLIEISLSRTQSLVDQKDASFEESNEYEINYAYKFANDFSATLWLAYSQDLRSPEDSSIGDIKLNLTKIIIPKLGYLNYGLNLLQTIPASKDSKDRQDLQYGLALGAKALTKVDVLFGGRLNFEGKLLLTQYFHRYDVAYDETLNNQYAFLQNIKTIFLINRALKLSLDLTHKNIQTYRGVAEQKLEHTEEISIDLNSEISMALGHTIAQPLYKTNGDSNISAFSDDNSRIYIGLTVAL